MKTFIYKWIKEQINANNEDSTQDETAMPRTFK